MNRRVPSSSVSVPPHERARDVLLFINGILTRPGDAFAWTDLAVRWMINHGPAMTRGDRFEYGCPALLRRFFLRGHACDLARVIGEYAAGHGHHPRLHLAGHSNGCELIARAVQLSSAPIASIHLIAGAVDRDFRVNGLGDRILRGQVGKAWCYCSHGDYVLKYAARPSQIFKAIGLGYGDLGGRGPIGVTPQHRIETHWADDYGHSDWFLPDNFDRTMRLVLTNALNA